MPKQSFRDLLNFKPIQPVVDPERDPKGNSKVVKVAPNDFSRKRAVKTTGYTKQELEEIEKNKNKKWWDVLLETNAYKQVKAVADQNQSLVKRIDTDLNSAYGFLKEILDSPTGNKYVKSLKNDRKDTLTSAIKSHVNAVKSDYYSLKSNPLKVKNTTNVTRNGKVKVENPENNTSDPFTFKDYTDTSKMIRDKDEIPQLKSLMMPLSTEEAREIGKEVKESFIHEYDNLQALLTGKNCSTVMFTAESIRNAILGKSDERLGRYIQEFVAKDALYRDLNENIQPGFKDEGKNRNYYINHSDPFNPVTNLDSPASSLRYAKSLGFCEGYKDLYGFSLDSSHLWGITIEPYEFPGYYKSLAPPLPQYEIPVWKPDVDNKTFTWDIRTLDYGKTPPVVSYSLNIGTSIEKDINLFNGSTIKIPMGFSYNYSLTLVFADDQHSSMKNYMNYYYNCIHRPHEGLMAPYELCSFLITITSFKPGLKVKNMLKLICVPVGYSVTQSGEGSPNAETVSIGFSVVGMRTSMYFDNKVDVTLRGIWQELSWNDIILRPVSNHAVNYKLDGDWIKEDLRSVKDLQPRSLQDIENSKLISDSRNSVMAYKIDTDPTIKPEMSMSEEDKKFNNKVNKLSKKGKTKKVEKLIKKRRGF